VLDFVALDFETANGSRGSVCATGMARVEGGVITAEDGWLIRPPDTGGFSPFNIGIHGIRPQDVADAPMWPESLVRILEFVGDSAVVAHNAQFDIGVIREACLESGQEWPDLNYFCSLGLSRAVLQLPSYRLPWVATALDLPTFQHHDARADARTAALITVALAKRLGVDTVVGLLAAASIRPGYLDGDGWRGARIAKSARTIVPAMEINADGPLLGESVCFTGALTRFSRQDARAEVVRCGGTFTTVPGKKTTLLVVGDLDPTTFRPGAHFSSKMQKAIDANAQGQRIEILTEDDFLDRLDVDRGEAPYPVRLTSRSRVLPDHVVAQSRGLHGAAMEYWDWFDEVLRDPSGRAMPGTACISCGEPIPHGTHWKCRDRGVCGNCNDRLKRAAHRLWLREGLGPGAEDGALAPPAGP